MTSPLPFPDGRQINPQRRSARFEPRETHRARLFPMLEQACVGRSPPHWTLLLPLASCGHVNSLRPRSHHRLPQLCLYKGPQAALKMTSKEAAAETVEKKRLTASEEDRNGTELEKTWHLAYLECRSLVWLTNDVNDVLIFRPTFFNSRFYFNVSLLSTRVFFLMYNVLLFALEVGLF